MIAFRLLSIALLAPCASLLGSAPALVESQARQSSPSAPERSSRAETDPAPIILVRAWAYLTSDITRYVGPGVGDARVYLPLGSGKLIALELKSGQEVWSVETGQSDFAPIVQSNLVILVFASPGNSANGGPRAIVRAFHQQTGITAWATPLPDRVRSFHYLPELGLVLAGLENGSLLAIRSPDGAIAWSVRMPAIPAGEPIVEGPDLFIGCEDGQLCRLKLNGTEIRISGAVRLAGALRARPAVVERSIFAGTMDGYVYKIDRNSLKVRWTRRVGAAIRAAVELFEEKVIVGSYDNYVYAFAQSNGEPRWKRGADARIQSNMFRWNDAVLVAASRTTKVLAIDLRTGAVLTVVDLNRESGVCGPLAGTADMLLVPTEEGIYALSIASLPGSTASPGERGTRLRRNHVYQQTLAPLPSAEGGLNSPILVTPHSVRSGLRVGLL